MALQNDGERHRKMKEAMRAIAADLSSWEVLYLQRELQQRTIRLAGLEDLPSELVCEIVPYLSTLDIRACSLVSRGWRSSWLQDTVLRTASSVHFPGLIEMHGQANIPKTFQEAANKFTRWFKGLRKEVFLFDCSWDTDAFTNVMRPSPEYTLPKGLEEGRAFVRWFYDDGRIAWQVDPKVVIVDNLRTRTRQWVSDDVVRIEGQPRLVRFGGDLIVLNVFGANILLVYHLKHREWRRIRLSASLRSSVVRHEHLTYNCTNGSIIVWKWGGIATQLEVNRETPSEVSELAGGRLGTENLLSHPTDPKIVYVVQYWRRTTGVNYSYLTVIKYLDEKAVSTFTHKERNSSSDDAFFRDDIGIEAVRQKSSPYGSWLISSIKSMKNGVFFKRLFYFNVLTGRFWQYNTQDLREPDPSFDRHFYWHNDILICHHTYEGPPMEPMELISLKSLRSERRTVLHETTLASVLETRVGYLTASRVEMDDEVLICDEGKLVVLMPKESTYLDALNMAEREGVGK